MSTAGKKRGQAGKKLKMPSATKNLFEKRFLDLQKLFIIKATLPGVEKKSIMREN
jgi:hypothetical protein